MFCINCGAKNDDGAKFCENCGASLPEIENAQNNVANETLSEEAPAIQVAENQVETVEASPVITEEKAPETAQEVKTEPEVQFAPSPAKKIKKTPIIAAVLAVVILGALFWDSVLAAVAPKSYAQLVIMDTIEEIAEEIMTAEKNILGFKVEEEKELTCTVEAILNELNDVDLNGLGFKLTAKNSESKKKLMYVCRGSI